MGRRSNSKRKLSDEMESSDRNAAAASPKISDRSAVEAADSKRKGKKVHDISDKSYINTSEVSHGRLSHSFISDMPLWNFPPPRLLEIHKRSSVHYSPHSFTKSSCDIISESSHLESWASGSGSRKKRPKSPTLVLSDDIEQKKPKNPTFSDNQSGTTDNLHGKPHSNLDEEVKVRNIAELYSSLPELSQSRAIWEILRRSYLPTLQFTAETIAPALKKDFISELPREIAEKVLINLDLDCLCMASQVCKKWNQIIDCNEMLWKKLLIREGWYSRLKSISSEWKLNHQREKAGPSSLNSNVISRPSTPYNLRSSSRMSSSPVSSSESPIEFPSIGSIASSSTSVAYSRTASLESSVNLESYKEVYKRFHKIRQNWFKGVCSSTLIPAEENNVITCMILDGDRIIAGSEEPRIMVYNVNNGQIIYTLYGHDGGVWAMELCGPKNRYLVSGSTDRTVRVWDLDVGCCTSVLRGHTSTIRSLSVIQMPSCPESYRYTWNNQLTKFSCDPHEWIIISGSRDRTARVWTFPGVKNGESNQKSSGISSKRPSNSRKTNSGVSNEINPSNDPPSVVSCEFILEGHTDSVRTLAAQGPVAVTGSYDTSLRVWSLITGKCMFQLRGHTNKVYNVCIDVNARLVMSSSMDHTIRVWSLNNGSCLRVLEGHSSLVGLLQLRNLNYRPSYPFKSTITNRYRNSISTYNNRRNSQPNNGQLQTPLHDQLSGKLSDFNCNRFYKTKDSSFPILVSAAADGLLKIWDVHESSPIQTLHGHPRAITCFNFDCDKLVSGSEDIIKLWDMRTGMYIRDMSSRVQSAWRIALDWRRCVSAIQRDGITCFEVMNFDLPD